MREVSDIDSHHDWESIETLPPLADGELQIWRLKLSGDGLFSYCASYLSPQERDRAERRRAGRVRDEFAVGRACLRILLGNALGVAPLDVALEENPYGKPCLSNNHEYLSFNVSHSKGTILVGLSRQGAIGIDVEYIDETIDVMEIAQSAFTANELEMLKALSSPDARRRAFYYCWTQKEAITKADGRGLSLPLSSFEVLVSPARSAPVLVHGSAGTDKRYLLSDIPLGAYAVGAVATDSPNCRMLLLHFPLSTLSNHLVKKEIEGFM